MGIRGKVDNQHTCQYLYPMPKRTYQPKKKKRATTHGFLVRMRTPGGKSVVRRRRAKGRTKLSV
jgi:large subunit ribosomal protein L34